MTKKVTIDTSVFVTALMKDETRLDEAEEILRKVYRDNFYVIIPTTVLTE
ncbi:MAG: hypothetical protein R6W90_16100 [Ignavibacteriaceae bacterium]